MHPVLVVWDTVVHTGLGSVIVTRSQGFAIAGNVSFEHERLFNPLVVMR